MKIKHILLTGVLFATSYVTFGQNYSTNKSLNPSIKDTIELTTSDLESNNDLNLVASKYLPSGEYVLKTPSYTDNMTVETTSTSVVDSKGVKVNLKKSKVECDGIIEVVNDQKYNLISAINASISNSYRIFGKLIEYTLNTNLTPKVSSNIKEYSGKSLSELTDDQASKLVTKVEADMRSSYALRKK